MATGDVHTYPVGDTVEHEISQECVCGPTVEPVPRSDGSMGWHLLHHSLDGREARESPIAGE